MNTNAFFLKTIMPFIILFLAHGAAVAAETTPAATSDATAASPQYEVIPLTPEPAPQPTAAPAPTPAPAPAPAAVPAPVQPAPAAPAPAPPSNRPRRWRRGEPVPPGYHLESRAHKGLVIPGAVLLGLGWFTSIITGYVGTRRMRRLDKDDSVFRPLFIPVAGPIVSLARLNPDKVSHRVSEPFLILDAIFQLAGAAMVVAGVAWRKRILIADTAGLRLRPVALTGDLCGVGFAGTF